ncbi:MAG TPA: hypothetical protein PKD90_13830 [Phnomibacter sp.]|nr:hypothetical protein [Phnomibacter sp.]
MKALMTLLLATSLAGVAIAQNDKMSLHNGKSMEVKILKVGEFTVHYTFPGETAEQVISKYMVGKVEYGSGRTEEITEKITVNGKEDWEQVVILEDKAAAVGLVKKDEVRGKTSGLMSFHTAGSADKKSLRKLKESAAEMGCPFVLMTSDKDNMFTNQSIKKAVAYAYK